MIGFEAGVLAFLVGYLIGPLPLSVVIIIAIALAMAMLHEWSEKEAWIARETKRVEEAKEREKEQCALRFQEMERWREEQRRQAALKKERDEQESARYRFPF